MGEVHYMISETAKRVEVAATELHQWEEDYALPIGRTEMGHRFYTEEDLQLFRCIKRLKGQGVTSDELKHLIPDLIHTRNQRRMKAQAKAEAGETAEAPKTLKLEDCRDIADDSREELILIARIVQDALEKNNIVLGESICTGVSETVTHNIEFLLKAKERGEEERFRSLDQLIRQQQAIRKETAKSTMIKRFFKLMST